MGSRRDSLVFLLKVLGEAGRGGTKVSPPEVEARFCSGTGAAVPESLW